MDKQIIIKRSGNSDTQVINDREQVYISYNVEGENVIIINHSAVISNISKAEADTAFYAIHSFLFTDTAHSVMTLELGEKTKYISKGKAVVNIKIFREVSTAEEANSNGIKQLWRVSSEGWDVEVEFEGGASNEEIENIAIAKLKNSIGEDIDIGEVAIYTEGFIEPKKKVWHLQISYE